MNKIWMFAIAMGLIFGLGACKPKQSAYKAAYDKAQEKAVDEPQRNVPAPAPVPRPQSSDAASTKEKIRIVSGDGLRNYSVVIGSFMNKTNAENLKARMEAEGYRVVLAQNERDMYRVIVASYDEKYDAAEARDRFKAKYPENEDFQKAWLLERQ